MDKKSFHLYNPNKKQPTEYELKHCITEEEYRHWKNNFNFVEIEGGHVSDKGEIFKYFPATESKIK